MVSSHELDSSKDSLIFFERGKEGEIHSKQTETEKGEKQVRDMETETDRPRQTLAWEAGDLGSG